MKYRDAKLLHNGDEITCKADGIVYQVIDIQVFGQYKKVKINCCRETQIGCGHLYSFYNDEVE